MSDEELQKIEDRANAATPGPWCVEGRWHSGKNIATLRSWNVPVAIESPSDGWWEASEKKLEDQACGNGDFIAHARTDVPALIAEVRRLRLEASVWRRLHESVERHETQLIAGVGHAARAGDFAAADRLLEQSGYDE